MVQLNFARASDMADGAGQLAILSFRANSGASVDLTSELAIAEFSIADETGVIDLRQKDTLVLTGGKVVVSASQTIDNAGNGLPDAWDQQHNMDLFSQNALLDPENDGLPNLLEYAFGLNPTAADAQQRAVQNSLGDDEGVTYQKIGFYRRLNGAVTYKVQESADLDTWDDISIPLRMNGSAQNMGDGTEYVEVLGTRPIIGPSAKTKGFLRVGVDHP